MAKKVWPAKIGQQGFVRNAWPGRFDQKDSPGGIDQTGLIRKRGQKGLAIMDGPEKFDQDRLVTENCPERIGQSGLAKDQAKQIG